MATLVYEDFELEIAPPVDGVFSVRVNSAAGQGRASFELPFTEEELTERIETLAVDEPEARELGQELFNTLFVNGVVRDLYQQSLGRLNGRPEIGLRIKLHIDPSDPKSAYLGEIPWEYMYHSYDFLNLHRHTPVVRYLDVPRPYKLQSLEHPLRILVVMSSPSNYPKLDLEKEKALLEKELGGLENIELVFLKNATSAALHAKLARNQFHVLHYMGHGGIDPKTKSGVLLLENATGGAEFLSGDELSMLLSDVSALRLVFLNACETAELAEESATSKYNQFGSVANALVFKGIPAVIAMQFPITDEAAIIFTQNIYPLLAQGNSIDYAVAEGRKAIRVITKSMEWGTPVLYMRVPDGRLFSLEHKQKIKDIATKAQTVLETSEQLHGGRYRIVKPLTQRGFTTIYRGRDTMEKRNVLVREIIIPREINPATLAHLTLDNHPHIVGTYDVFAEEDKLYIIAEFMEGGTLEDQLGEYKNLEIWQSLQQTDDICQALEFIHEKGGAHGNLKPSNILFTEKGIVKLEDTRVINNLVDTLTASGETADKMSKFMRTPYMPPEQTSFSITDPRADIYASGAILYRGITGEFYKDKPIRELRPMVPAWLANAVMKCLEQDPNDRYQTITEFRHALIYGDRVPELASLGKKFASAKLTIPAQEQKAHSASLALESPSTPIDREKKRFSIGAPNAWLWAIVGSWFTLLAVFLKDLLMGEEK